MEKADLGNHCLLLHKPFFFFRSRQSYTFTVWFQRYFYNVLGYNRKEHKHQPSKMARAALETWHTSFSKKYEAPLLKKKIGKEVHKKPQHNAKCKTGQVSCM